MNKLTALDRAYAMARPVVFAATPDTYDGPTPCTAWDVRTLLNHLIRVIDQFPVLLPGGSESRGLAEARSVGDAGPAPRYLLGGHKPDRHGDAHLGSRPGDRP